MSIRLKFILFFVSILLIPINLDVFGLEQTPRDVGFANKYVINVVENYFNVNVNANFLISSHVFNTNDKIIQFNIETGLDKENVGEIIIPLDLFDGEFTILLDNKKIPSNVNKTERSAIVSIEFDGKGEYTLDIIATKYLGVELKSNGGG